MNLQNENSFWATIWLMIFIALCVIVITLTVGHCINVDRYTSRGYTRTTLPGSDCTTWVKEAK